ncbi:MAG: DUF2795 domain-containing protein [Desulfomonilia bacterium]|jgi:hypothetical protein|uniref:DUF2795 domain-containing protein n=1 Tax=anaerobic digester metagenome TaxID=1263854 RepID=A0A485M8F9_9ZZZZ|nr:DUF2795 domain-containing protein [Pseudomonadota bacterium]HON38990.1 DUF2795 domain-containing protein [Deltaproteobacteria bacterium]HRS56960.1 DUF2795 domain-containing protein [Desulfomonilia bacterium]HPD22095.1 DUF2795 domain-containing protein [Deltaproteobacteria bacterium]HPX18933.1 DUF2795 domain-containing protein [Deltaproteobacteria bacterium]
MARYSDVSAAEVQQFLHGMDYPARKSDLIKKARDNGASDDIMRLLNDFPDQDFSSPVDVSKAISGLK